MAALVLTLILRERAKPCKGRLSMLAPAFIAVWYSLGIALAGGLGALLGPWVLRW